MPRKKLSEITIEDAAMLEPKRKFVPQEEDDFEEVDISNPRKKSKTGALKPGSPINMGFIPEAKFVPDEDVAVALHNLKTICRKKRCPMFIYFEMPNNKDDNTIDVTDFITAEEMNLKHEENDKILQHIKISRGFVAVERNNSINMDDLD